MVTLKEIEKLLIENYALDYKLEKEFYEIERADIPQNEKDAKQYKVMVKQDIVKARLDVLKVELKNTLWAEMFPMKMSEVKKEKENK